MPIGFPTQEHGLLFHLSQASFVEHNAFLIYYFSKAINKHKTTYHLFQLCKKKGVKGKVYFVNNLSGQVGL